MPPRTKPKKPHPRSLDALFPAIRTVPKQAVRYCTAGHRQWGAWKRGDPCGRCDQDKAERLRAEGAKAEKAAWSAMMGPPPRVMILRVTHGRDQVFHTDPRLARRQMGRR